jgi:Ni/Fe-hydrogenase subunit HybB-like protein
MTTSAFSQKQPFRLPFSKGFLTWIGFLTILLAIGIYSAITVFVKGLVITNMSDSVPWGLWITIDLSSIALGAGAFTLSAIVYIFGIKRLQPIIRLAVLVGFVGYTSALLTLVMDIGRPDRFWHPWVFWNVHSVLLEVTMCITIYLLILSLGCSCHRRAALIAGQCFHVWTLHPSYYLILQFGFSNLPGIILVGCRP